jgi:hypothetical protein
VAWVKLNLIKIRCFGLLNVPSSTTWCWRKIIKLRELAKNFFKFQVGNGSDGWKIAPGWHFIGQIWI